ncbi:MAG: hypothetical protein LBN23_03915 [Paludibacter sp.]|jgi:N-acetylglutamate synthase-like GNAT family acetyltransferase|nr:hypothetical protein [Paludibacter sp.]
MNLSILEIIGYTASVIIAFSMTISSIVRFRWVNLAGAITFSAYGFIIGAYPVGVLNAFIVASDIYYLVKIYGRKEIFNLLQVSDTDRYLQYFINFNKEDILNFCSEFDFLLNENSLCYLVLRNTHIAGVVVAHSVDNETLKIDLDYVTVEYRDSKCGKFFYDNIYTMSEIKDITKIFAVSKSKKHQNYLKNLGFTENENGEFVLNKK